MANLVGSGEGGHDDFAASPAGMASSIKCMACPDHESPDRDVVASKH